MRNARRIAGRRAWRWVFGPLVAVSVAVGGSGDALAKASTLYNMDRFLNEPHPFATQVQPPPVAPALRPAPVAPAPVPDIPEIDDNDPLEPVNRLIFGFNKVLNDFLIGPIAKGYNLLLPEIARDAVANMFDNANLPVVIANDLLQGELTRGLEAAGRLVVNSTVGVLGLVDVAERLGLEKHKEDFGQTLAVWGVGEGLYLVLPVFGPSNPRDAFGNLFVDRYFDPFGLWLSNTDRDEISYAITGARGIITYADVVEELERLEEASVDFYGAIRSLYRQRRAAEIANGKPESSPSFGFDIEIDP